MKLLTPKVIIIDDNIALEPTYHKYFDAYLDYNLVGVYDSAKEALSEYRKKLPHIIFLAVSLQDISGIQCITLFKELNPEVKIIMLGEPNNFELVKKAFRVGANGFLTKPVSQRTLYNALYSIECQGAFISNDIAKKVISLFRQKSYTIFSNRENEVVALLQQGATYKTIAEKLFVTPSAVNFHIQNIYTKLNVNSKSEALLRLQEMEKVSDSIKSMDYSIR